MIAGWTTMATLSVFSTAMFAEPTITQIEEVGRLVHLIQDSQILDPGFSYLAVLDSDNCTGTVIRRPLRQICT